MTFEELYWLCFNCSQFKAMNLPGLSSVLLLEEIRMPG